LDLDWSGGIEKREREKAEAKGREKRVKSSAQVRCFYRAVDKSTLPLLEINGIATEKLTLPSLDAGSSFVST
jgi:hypothetical protein